MYRAQPIETCDTVSLRVTLANRSSLLTLFTHACRDTIGPRLAIQGATGAVVWESNAIAWRDARGVEVWPLEGRPAAHMLERFARVVHGIPDETRLWTSLESARNQTVVVNAAAEAVAVADVPADQVERIERGGNVFHAIANIEAIFNECVARGQMPHESGRLPGSRPAGALDVTGYQEFRGPRFP